jgi:amino acid transporter
MGKAIEFRAVAILSFILLGVSTLLGLLFYISSDKNPDPMLFYTYVLVAIAAVITLLFTILGVFSSKKSLKSSAIVLGIALVLIVIAYTMASDKMPTFFGVEAFHLTSTILKLVDTSLYLLYILTGIAFIGLFYTEIARSIK